MNIFLIRHGESEGNRMAKLQGCEDFDLSMKGKRQALLLGEYLADTKINYLYSSDLTRANQTAEAVERHQDCNVVQSSNLREINLGPLQGKTREQIYAEFPEVRNKNLLRSGLEGTETDEEITKRCENLYYLLRSAKENETIAVVSHGGFLTIFLMYLLAGENWNTLHRPFRIDNTGVSKISWKDEKLVIHYINQCHHLQRE
ncbi:histidine phosphatase family protein [Salibacterium salarium]|uniref:histidine phosphatase family protein n=1 Tax=Salibacterium salarium TaxID=284579 RepID=UPI0027D8A408|nr:histidine phosphatase family protein [Salibacterium salarium]